MVRRELSRMLRVGGDNNAAEHGHRRHQLLEYAMGQTITVFGYKRNSCKTILANILIILSLGMLRLLFHWFPKLWIQCTHDQDVLKRAERLLIEDNYKGKWKTYAAVPIDSLSLSNGAKQEYYIKDNLFRENDTIAAFTYKSMRFVLEDDHFEPLCGISDGLAQNSLHKFPGLSADERASRLNVYGPNEIRVPKTPILKLILLEVLTPFYVFQVGSIILWIIEFYVYFVGIIATLTILGVAGHVYQVRKNENTLSKSVRAKDTIGVYVKSAKSLNGSCATDTLLDACTTTLVPGDLVQLKEGYVYCDTVLLSGTCLVDESMLTGESIQILKTPIPNNANVQNREDSTPHMLFAGTRIVQANADLRALVINTGFLTTKGSLIRSIMYPAPVDYAFDRDCNKFCFVMFLIGVGCAIHIAVTKMKRGIPAYDLIIKTLDSITILLPAALPATLTIGKFHPLNNLRKRHIFCTNSKVLPNCGSIDVVCLDKTGTITEDKLHFIGVVSEAPGSIKEKDFGDSVERGMAVCHNLAVHKDVLQGDHLEVQMFKAAGSTILPGNASISLRSGHVINVLERHQFSSNLRRMSVIVQCGSDFEVFCKGSPEILKPLCRNPSDISDEELARLTKQGYRVISLATRSLKNFRLTQLGTLAREDVERDLTFLGYLIFENKLKPASKDVIKELQKGNLSIKMITGDNIETAVSVAKECGILSTHEGIKVLSENVGLTTAETIRATFTVNGHVAITGSVWSQLLSIAARDDAELLKMALPKIHVFARMASVQKQQVVEQLQELGLNVCMCGDGANDCSALKAADVGISLTESESSMAAHLTSKVASISAVLDVVREGRSALVTIVTIVKVTITSSILQYIGILLLYDLDATFTDWQFLYLDMHMLVYGFFFGFVDAHVGPLSPKAPVSTLWAWKPNLSMVGQTIPSVLFQCAGLWLVRSQAWFVPYDHDPEVGNDFRSFENSVVFISAAFQYSVMVAVFSRGAPHRRPMWTNWALCISMVCFFVLDLILGLGNVRWLIRVFELMVPLDQDVRWQLLGLSVAHLATAVIIEEVIIEYVIGRYVLDKGQQQTDIHTIV